MTQYTPEQVGQMSDEKLNARIAFEVMGWELAEGAGFHGFKHWWKGDPQRRRCTDWKPATDGRAMVELVEAARVRGWFVVLGCVEESCWCQVFDGSMKLLATVRHSGGNLARVASEAIYLAKQESDDHQTKGEDDG